MQRGERRPRETGSWLGHSTRWPQNPDGPLGLCCPAQRSEVSWGPQAETAFQSPTYCLLPSVAGSVGMSHFVPGGWEVACCLPKHPPEPVPPGKAPSWRGHSPKAPSASGCLRESSRWGSCPFLLRAQGGTAPPPQPPSPPYPGDLRLGPGTPGFRLPLTPACFRLSQGGVLPALAGN